MTALALVARAHPWDPRLGADETALALAARVHAGAHFRCVREENDGTIALGEVDYRCEPAGRDGGGRGYWVGTDAHGITGVQPMG